MRRRFWVWLTLLFIVSIEQYNNDVDDSQEVTEDNNDIGDPFYTTQAGDRALDIE